MDCTTLELPKDVWKYILLMTYVFSYTGAILMYNLSPYYWYVTSLLMFQQFPRLAVDFLFAAMVEPNRGRLED